MSAFPSGIPGIRTERTATPVRILKSTVGAVRLPSALLVAGSKSRDPGNTGDLDTLRPGTLLGLITASGKLAPFTFGPTTGTTAQNGTAYTSGGTSIAVAPAAAVEIVRRIGTSGNLTYIGPTSANGAISTYPTSIAFSAVNTSTGVITTSTLGQNLAVGALVCATDGTATPLALLGNEYGLKVTDENAVDIDVPCGDVLIGGILDSSNIPFWPSDTGIRAWLVSQLNTYGRFWFDHIYGL